MSSLNFDITSQETKDRARKASASGGFMPEQIVEIKQCYVKKYESGACFLVMSVENEDGKTYTFPDMYIISNNETGNVHQKAFDVIKGLFILLGVNGHATPTEIKIREWDKNVHAFVDIMKTFESYEGIIGRKVGCVIRYRQQYPISLAVNGYTNIPITSINVDESAHNVEKNLPTTVYMPDYSKEPQPVFEPMLWFDPETRKTLIELQADEGIEATQVDLMVDNIARWNKKLKDANGNYAYVMSADAYNKSRRSKLIKRLQKYAETFVPEQFIAINDLAKTAASRKVTESTEQSSSGFDFDDPSAYDDAPF